MGVLSAAGYQVYAINPLAVAHYRDRHHVSGAKSDASMQNCWPIWCAPTGTTRLIAGDSPEAEAIKVLAHAHQSMIWTRTRHTNALRSALREYYPAALEAFEDLDHGDALGVLGRAPTPEQGAHLNLTRSVRAQTRWRGNAISPHAPAKSRPRCAPNNSSPRTVTVAFAATTRATVGIIAELNHQIAELETTLAEHFETHPDADIYLSLPGLGVVLGARVLGEFGDDPTATPTPSLAETTPELHPDRGLQ